MSYVHEDTFLGRKWWAMLICGPKLSEAEIEKAECRLKGWKPNKGAWGQVTNLTANDSRPSGSIAEWSFELVCANNFFVRRLPQRNTPAVVDKRQRSKDLQQDRGIEDCDRRL